MKINKDTQAKHWASKGMRVVNYYWDLDVARNRSIWLTEQLKKYEFDSILEVGCFCGRNLKYITETFPKTKVAGIDINNTAIEFAKEKLPDADLRLMTLYDVDTLKEKFDIIFTCGVLIHVPPSDLKGVIEKFIVMAPKTFVHLEQIGHGELAKGPKELKPNYKVSNQIQWDQDIAGIYESFGFKASITDIPEEHQTNGARHLIVVNKQ